MNELKINILELKRLQTDPHFFLYNYFGDLKHKIDLKYSLEQDEKYFELVAKVESIEQEYYSNMKPIDLFNNEINRIEKQLEDIMNVNLKEEFIKKINQIKYNIEGFFLKNKSFIFLKNWEKDKNVLIIINDKYLETNFFDKFKMIHYYQIIDYSCENLTEEICVIYYFLMNLMVKIKDLDTNIISHDFKYVQEIDEIKDLNLSGIKIESMQKDGCFNKKEDVFKKFNNLKSICITQSRCIRHIPRFLPSNLTKLDFSSCNIRYLGDYCLNDLKNLQIIVLKRNQIHNIHYKAFEGLVHLEKIDLSVNQIQHIPLDLLCGLTNLKEFSIHHNKIELIHEKLFNGLIALNEIDLSYNQINRISGKDIFRGLDNLREIYLNGNLLSFISIKTFEGLANLERVDLCANLLSESYKILLTKSLRRYRDFNSNLFIFL